MRDVIVFAKLFNFICLIIEWAMPKWFRVLGVDQKHVIINLVRKGVSHSEVEELFNVVDVPFIVSFADLRQLATWKTYPKLDAGICCLLLLWRGVAVTRYVESTKLL